MSRHCEWLGRIGKVAAISLSVSLVATCKTTQSLSDPDADDAARQIIGMDHPYKVNVLNADNLQTSFAKRRLTGWQIAHQIFTPAPRVGAEGANANPDDDLALWQTWFTSDEIVKMFEVLYRTLPPERRSAVASGGAGKVTSAEIDCALKKYISEDYLKRRYGSLYNKMILKRIAQLKDRSARSLNGVARGATVFNMPVARHYLANYARVINCTQQFAETYDGDLSRNFAACFEEEFPPDSVAIKAVWARDEEQILFYDTTAKGIDQALSGEKTWQPKRCGAELCGLPGSDERLDDLMFSATKVLHDEPEKMFRLLGLHIATKEVRDWTWTSLWWSDTPDSDFGADRPEWFGKYPGRTRTPLRHYKMCIATSYQEGDTALLAKREGFVVKDSDTSLEGAVLSSYLKGNVRPPGSSDEVVSTWCSNPVVERDAGMADTNCIGCHQHAGPGSNMENVRHQERTRFPADYAWSFEFYMDMIAKENDNFKDKFVKITETLANAPQESCATP